MTETDRYATIKRETNETKIHAAVWLDSASRCDVETGIGFLDHMLSALAKHARIGLELKCRGDLDVDGHHTSEDCALVLGQVIDIALGGRVGIRRFGSAYVPMDEALARVVIDLSGRPHAVVNLGLKRERIGAMATENITHVFQSLAITLRATIHVDCIRGQNDHHRSEAAFKALALALRQAIEVIGTDIPSTKGSL